MGLCSAAPEVVEDTVITVPVLKFQQSEEVLSANGGLVYHSSCTEMPVSSVGFDSRFVYFIKNENELFAAKR